jgi:hypothetical protein
LKRFAVVVLAAYVALSSLFILPASSSTHAEQLTVMSWNVESGGADAVTISGQIAAFDGIDLWGFSEVNGDGDALLYENGAEVGESADFARVTGSTGGADRLVVLYDDDRFDLLGSDELEEINVGGNVRASLVVTLAETASDLQFIFMVNHLYRSDESGRHTQASLLNQWAANQTLPIVATGDYNFDWDIATEAHDLGYDLMTTNGVWEWIKPATLVTTQCSGWPCGFDSVLDFVFAAGEARDWQATSEIMVRDGDFPDDGTTSDHRPVRAVFDLPALVEETPVWELFLPRIIRPVLLPTNTPTPTQPVPTRTPTVTPTVTNVPTASLTSTATATQLSASYECGFNAYNCSDFDTQSEAQAVFDYCVSQGAGDVHQLDSDDDEEACESLPPGFRVVR